MERQRQLTTGHVTDVEWDQYTTASSSMYYISSIMPNWQHESTIFFTCRCQGNERSLAECESVTGVAAEFCGQSGPIRNGHLGDAGVRCVAPKMCPGTEKNKVNQSCQSMSKNPHYFVWCLGACKTITFL